MGHFRWHLSLKWVGHLSLGGAFMAYSSMLRCSTSDIIKLQFAQHTYVLQYTSQMLECALNINYGVIIAVVDT